MNRGPQVSGVQAECTGACHVMNDHHGGQSGCTVCHSPRLVAAGAEASVFEHQLMGSGKRMRHREALYPGEPTSGVPESACLQCHTGGYQVTQRYLGSTDRHAAVRDPAVPHKLYNAPQADVHRQMGLQCQDCHTSYDIHGADRAELRDNAVEIECSDCHGTAGVRPWDLPLGYMDAPSDATTPRGIARMVLAMQRHGQPAPRTGDFSGYLLSARGTPLKNVIREGETIVLYDVAGQRHLVPAPQLRPGHERLDAQQRECYSCHSRSVLSEGVRLGMGKDGLLAPILESLGYADGTTLPAAAYTPHDVVRR